MSDYRRLISYIYEYEGKEKGKNVGFVKLEARNGQCRLNLSVKKVYMGSSAIGVFLLSKAGTEVFLGNIFIRSGAGEFRAVVDAKNVEGNGGGLDTYYGLTIHDVKNPWRSYTTIWEDAVEPETLPGSLPGDQGNGDTVKMLPAQEILPGSPDQSEEEPVMAVASVVREIEAEIAREEERRSREEMILDPASAPEMLPVGPTAPSIPEGPAAAPEPAVVPAPEELPGRPSAPPVPEELPARPPVLPVPEELPARPPAPKETPDEPETLVFPEELPPAPAPGISPAEPVRRVPYPEGDPPAPVSRAEGGHPFRFPVRQAALPLLLPGPGRLCRSMTPGLRRPGSLGQTRRLPLPGPETAARGLEQLRRPARLSRKRILPFPALRSWKTRRSSDPSRKQRM